MFIRNYNAAAIPGQLSTFPTGGGGSAFLHFKDYCVALIEQGTYICMRAFPYPTHLLDYQVGITIHRQINRW
jgi:hypothetical protein